MNELTELLSIAEEHRSELPADFFVYLDQFEAALSDGAIPDTLKKRGFGASDWFSELGPIVIDELSILICGEDEKYADVREDGQHITKAAISAVAASVANAVGLGSPIAVGAIAFLAYAILSIGKSSFCREMADHTATD